MEKSLRIKANIGKESVVHVPMKRDVDMFEMLSLNLSTEGIYKRHSSNYGVIIGRVTVNGGLGVPNAKISIFIPLKASDALRPEIKSLYPYRNITDLDSDGRRYNLLPMNYNDNVHVAVGSFPTSQAVLDNDIYLEIYEKYYKYTTVTNEAGDYMLYGVPVGTQTIHMDVDISDIGYLSQKPYHMIDKGYSEDMFDSPTKFKGGTNLDLLPQIFSENEALNVYPFWGDEEEDEIAITRKDFELQYEITPTCIFMGSVVTDSDENYISEGCTISEKSGDMSQLRASEGKIEIMRYNPMGEIEEYNVKDNKLIDGNGVFCFQVPMNLNYVTTSEEGKLVRSIDPTVGIPTTARVRFRLTLEGEGEDIAASHTMSYLVPNNPESSPIGVKLENNQTSGFVTTADYINDMNDYATFGNSFTDKSVEDDSFRDLLWNCVYSVKNYIPRVELRDDDEGGYYVGNGLQHTGIKGVNKSGAEGKNPFPYNKMNLSTSFLTWYTSQSINSFLDKIDGTVDWYLIQVFPYLSRFGKYFKRLRSFFTNGETYEAIQNEDETFGRNIEDTDGVSFDFYNDWINGCLYFPKVKYDSSTELCECGKQVSDLNVYNNTKYVVNDTCSLDYRFGKAPSHDDVYGIDEDIISGFKDFGSFDGGFLTTTNLTRHCIKKSIFEHPNWAWMGLEQEAKNKEAPNTFVYHVSERKITNGLTVRKESSVDPSNVQFSYAPLFFNDDKLSGNTFNGFKTDIILLGSIDDTNFHNIPSVKGLKLPKTTATLVNTYRSDSTGKNYNEGFTEGDKYAHIDLNNGNWLYFENKLRDDDQEMQSASTKTGNDVSSSSSSKYAQSYLHKTNGSFWGSTEYTKRIRIENRFVRYWMPWSNGRFISNEHDTTDSSIYFRYKKNENSDWDRGMHCLLGGGLFFGRSRYSMFDNDYVTKPKSCINLSRICEMSVVSEDSMTFPDKKNRESLDGHQWTENVQFQFTKLPYRYIPKVSNDVDDINFFEYEGEGAYRSPNYVPDGAERVIGAGTTEYSWQNRPPMPDDVGDDDVVYVSSRIVNLNDKGNKSTDFWKYQRPCLWFMWGWVANSTTEIEYVFAKTPKLDDPDNDVSVKTTYFDDYGHEVDWPDSAKKTAKDDLYCPRLSYVLNNETKTVEFTNQQEFYDPSSDEFVQFVSMRTRETPGGTWSSFSEPKIWNIKEYVDDVDSPYHNCVVGSLENKPYVIYFNAPKILLIRIFGGDSEWVADESYYTPSYFYSTPNYPNEYTWCKSTEGEDYYETIMTNRYGVMGGTLDDGSERLPSTNVRYTNCGMSGIIGDSEITDFTNRSLFATLNSNKLHILTGEDDKSKTPSMRYRDNKIRNVNGFDGFLDGSVLKSYFSGGSYGRGEVILKHEEKCSNDYMLFRYGEKPKFNVDAGEDMYFKGKSYRFPVYDNSFYFYFGINSGETALHKLKRNFL